jgi:hypothetical protein
LHRYISEFEFRFNNNETQEIFAAVILALVIKSALRYKALTGPLASADPIDLDDPLSDEPS